MVNRHAYTLTGALNGYKNAETISFCGYGFSFAEDNATQASADVITALMSSEHQLQFDRPLPTSTVGFPRGMFIAVTLYPRDTNSSILRRMNAYMYSFFLNQALHLFDSYQT